MQDRLITQVFGQDQLPAEPIGRGPPHHRKPLRAQAHCYPVARRQRDGGASQQQFRAMIQVQRDAARILSQGTGGKKFIAGLPMKLATNMFAGR